MYLFVFTAIILISFLVTKINYKYRNIFIFMNTIVSVMYIVWRLTTIPMHNGIMSFILGVALYSAEFLGLVSLFNFQFLFTGRYKLEETGLGAYLPNDVPVVDVLICTYNEPLDLLEQTIIGSLNLDYNKDRFNIYVCDDGNRKELHELCNQFGVNYITREENEGAKAGNINNALKQIEGELFAILDADMVPKKDFLSKTVGYFIKENVSFVQTPQVYYNQDMYQYNLSKNIPNEQDFFMRDIQSARAAKNAVLHVGTNAVFRKKCIEQIGYYPTDSITEDMAVGMLLQAQGYDSVFINEELVLGLSATTFGELVKQRDRWCRGNLQVFKRYNIIFNKGLTTAQKISYIDGIIYWLSSLQKMVFLLSPLVYLISGSLIIDTEIDVLASMYIPYILGQILLFKILSPGTRSTKWAHYYEIAMAPHISLSVIKEVFCIKTKFNVTSKDLTTDKKQFHYREAMPHLVLIFVTLLAWLIAGINAINSNIHIGAFIINLGWSIYNLQGLVVAIQAAHQKPIYRKSERIELINHKDINIFSSNAEVNGKIIDISRDGSSIVVDKMHNLVLGDIVTVIIDNNKFKYEIKRIRDNYIGGMYLDLTVDQKKILGKIISENIHSHHKVKSIQESVKIEQKRIEEI